MDELWLESLLDFKPEKMAQTFPTSATELPPRPLSSSPRTCSPTSDRRSPYFRTHSPLSTYESSRLKNFSSNPIRLDRETTLRRDRNSPTLAETHLIHKEGLLDSSFSEEHWASEITSFVTNSPPKFLQVNNTNS
jgi:hypothetical protein